MSSEKEDQLLNIDSNNKDMSDEIEQNDDEQQFQQAEQPPQKYMLQQQQQQTKNVLTEKKQYFNDTTNQTEELEQNVTNNSQLDMQNVSKNLIKKYQLKEMEELEEENNQIEILKSHKQQIIQIYQQYQEVEKEKIKLEQRIVKLEKYKPYYEKYKKIKELLEQTMKKLEEKDKQLLKVQNDSNKEKDMLLAKIQNLEEVQTKFMAEREQSRQIKVETEQLFYEYQKQCELKEAKLKEEFKKVVNQNNILEQQISKLSEGITLRNETEKVNLELSKQLEQEKTFSQQLNEELIVQKQSQDTIQRKFEQQKLEYLELADIKQKYIAQQAIIQKQNILIEDLKNEKQDILQKFSDIENQFRLTLAELQVQKDNYANLEDNYSKSLIQIQQYNETINKMQNENQELQNNLNILLKKQEHEAQYKQQIENIKSDMIETKKTELDKINTIFCNLKTNNVSVNKLLTQSQKNLHKQSSESSDNFYTKQQKDYFYNPNQLLNI